MVDQNDLQSTDNDPLALIDNTGFAEDLEQLVEELNSHGNIE